MVWYRFIDHNIKLESRDFINLYKGLMYVLNKEFPSLSSLSKYFKDIALIFTELGLSIPWYLPTGLIAWQSYMQVKETKVQPLNFSKNSFRLKTTIKDKYDNNKQIRALMPNLIHSLDSTSLVLLINKYFTEYDSNFKNIYAIHDCFAVTCNNMDYIRDTLKIIYISLYSEKGYLLKLNDDMIKTIKNHLGDDFDKNTLHINIEGIKTKQFPDMNNVFKGTYNIQSITKSTYLIS